MSASARRPDHNGQQPPSAAAEGDPTESATLTSTPRTQRKPRESAAWSGSRAVRSRGGGDVEARPPTSAQRSLRARQQWLSVDLTVKAPDRSAGGDPRLLQYASAPTPREQYTQYVPDWCGPAASARDPPRTAPSATVPTPLSAATSETPALPPELGAVAEAERIMASVRQTLAETVPNAKDVLKRLEHDLPNTTDIQWSEEAGVPCAGPLRSVSPPPPYSKTQQEMRPAYVAEFQAITATLRGRLPSAALTSGKRRVANAPLCATVPAPPRTARAKTASNAEAATTLARQVSHAKSLMRQFSEAAVVVTPEHTDFFDDEEMRSSSQRISAPLEMVPSHLTSVGSYALEQSMDSSEKRDSTAVRWSSPLVPKKASAFRPIASTAGSAAPVPPMAKSLDVGTAEKRLSPASRTRSSPRSTPPSSRKNTPGRSTRTSPTLKGRKAFEESIPESDPRHIALRELVEGVRSAFQFRGTSEERALDDVMHGMAYANMHTVHERLHPLDGISLAADVPPHLRNIASIVPAAVAGTAAAAAGTENDATTSSIVEVLTGETATEEKVTAAPRGKNNANAADSKGSGRGTDAAAKHAPATKQGRRKDAMKMDLPVDNPHPSLEVRAMSPSPLKGPVPGALQDLQTATAPAVAVGGVSCAPVEVTIHTPAPRQFLPKEFAGSSRATSIAAGGGLGGVPLDCTFMSVEEMEPIVNPASKAWRTLQRSHEKSVHHLKLLGLL